MSLIPPLTERLDRLLPQTQCGQCGYDGCRPYAEAMARMDLAAPGNLGERIEAKLLALGLRETR